VCGVNKAKLAGNVVKGQKNEKWPKMARKGRKKTGKKAG
jgi:hypothetical protein